MDLDSGELICNAHPVSNGPDLAQRHCFVRAKKFRDFAIGEHHLGYDQAAPVLFLAQLVLDQKEQFIAILSAALDFEASAVFNLRQVRVMTATSRRLAEGDVRARNGDQPYHISGGLIGMRERVYGMNGSTRFSGIQEKGTRVTVAVALTVKTVSNTLSRTQSSFRTRFRRIRCRHL